MKEEVAVSKSHKVAKIPQERCCKSGWKEGWGTPFYERQVVIRGGPNGVRPHPPRHLMCVRGSN